MKRHPHRRRLPHDEAMGAFFEAFGAAVTHFLQGPFEDTRYTAGVQAGPFPQPWLVAPNEEGTTSVYLAFAHDLPGLAANCELWAVSHASDRFILATPDWLTPEELAAIPETIRVLHCGDLFAYGYVQPLGDGDFDGFMQYINRETAYELHARLLDVPIGRAHAREFENIVRDILIYTFAGKIEFESEQVRDADGLKIRDLVFRVTDPYGIWDLIRREHAKSSLFVVEAKNTQDRPGANEIRQIADYLKPNGVGLFGILVGRKPPTPQTRRDVVSRRSGGDGVSKTIVVLGEEDLIELLNRRMHRRQESCDEYIRRRVNDILLAV
jgi:hypothetical protein